MESDIDNMMLSLTMVASLQFKLLGRCLQQGYSSNMMTRVAKFSVLRIVFEINHAYGLKDEVW